MKTVCPKGRVGSNPTLSVSKTVINFIRYENQPAEVPKRLKGLPWKGSRSLVAARGFKSLLLRSAFERDKIRSGPAQASCTFTIED